MKASVKTVCIVDALAFIGEIFTQAKGALEDVYKIYCYHHDEANLLLKTYEREEEIKQHLNSCILSLK